MLECGHRLPFDKIALCRASVQLPVAETPRET